MDPRLPAAVPAVRVASRLQLSTTFATDSSLSSRCGARRGPRAQLPAPIDVRVVIRRHFPVAVPGQTGGARMIGEKVAADIALRRRPARRLREPRSVGRALAEEVLPLVAHAFDRGAVAAAGEEICARVAAACADPRGGARVLVVIDTFACPVVLRRPQPAKPVPRGGVACAEPESFVAGTATRCTDSETTVPTKKLNPYGVIGDRRPKPVVEERPKVEGLGTGVGSWTDSFSIFHR